MLNIFLGAIAGSGAFPSSNKPVYMSNLNCNGFENSLFYCHHDTDGLACSSQNLAGVICQGRVNAPINF